MRSVSTLALAVLGVATGCTFAPGSEGADAGGSTPPGSDGGSVMASSCDVSDPALTLCLDFEGSVEPIAVDSSAYHRDAITSSVSGIPRGAEQALAVDSSSNVAIAGDAHPIMSVPLTVELWVMAGQLPSKHATIIGSDLFSITLHPDASLSCDLAGDATSGGTVAVGAWTHVACTYDGSNVRAYVNGDVVACRSDASMTEPLSDDPGLMELGNDFDSGHALVGGLDDVHVYSSQLQDATLCTRAGRSGCSTSCPSGSDGSDGGGPNGPGGR